MEKYEVQTIIFIFPTEDCIVGKALRTVNLIQILTWHVEREYVYQDNFESKKYITIS